MAMKKKNIYSSTQIDRLKRELVGIIEYLQALDLENIQDKIVMVSGVTGGTQPRVVSSIEEVIETVVGEIQRSTNIIMAVYETEGMEDILQQQINITLERLDSLQDFYYTQLPNDMRHRILDIEAGVRRNGEPRIFTIVAATEEKQIKIRGRITEKILNILPKIDIIKEYNSSTVRGGVEATPAMKRFEKKRQQSLNKEQ